ncbi:MAG TPA: hypothetical protein VG097_08675 [Gemmata sp.]|nr:hypothetical protein [Gemmata sp.]
MQRNNGGVMLLLAAGLFGITAQADEPALEASVTVLNTDGKESQVTELKFTTGTHRLAWLANPDGKTEDDRKGPLALEVREIQSTTYTKGVVTYVPISHIESVKYDYDNKVINLSVKGLKGPLKGTLQYKGLNALNFSGKVDDKATTFSAGVIGKSTVKAVTFSGAKALPEAKKTGTTWAIQISQPAEKDPTLTVRNLKVLYHYSAGVEKLEDSIPVRKGALLPLNGTVKRFEILATDPNTNIAAAEVDTATSTERIVAIPLIQELDKKTGTLIGFIGEVDVGWKLFPLHTIKVITLTDVKKKVE